MKEFMKAKKSKKVVQKEKSGPKKSPVKGKKTKKIAKSSKKLAPKPKKASIEKKTDVAPKKKINVKEIFTSAPVIEKEGAHIRVLIGKAGLDGHDRGAKVIARACRDAGFEVVYTGLHQTPDMIVNTAIQEDVDVLGLSILSGAHNYLVPAVIKGLSAHGVTVGDDMLLLIGGIIPDADFQALKDAGVSMVFTPGTSVDSIITFIREHVKPKA